MALFRLIIMVAEIPIEADTVVEARKEHVQEKATEVPVVQSQERLRVPGPWRDAFCFPPEVDARAPRGVSSSKQELIEVSPVRSPQPPAVPRSDQLPRGLGGTGGGCGPPGAKRCFACRRPYS